ncbi:MAG: hypothetical protein GY759_21950, partial [Chloroflexi bacterium]|nr:hypothetical protein [Chloroflexota bacterium]
MVGFFLLPVAKLIALIPYASLWWTVFVVEKLARIPYGSLEVSTFGRLLSGLYYLAFGAGFLWWVLRQEQRATTLIPDGWRPFLVRGSVLAALLILPLWTGATYVESQPDGRLHLQLLGREQGAAFLIITPGGNRILLDPARESPVYPLDSILRSLPGGNQSLDLHILTRPDVDAVDLKAENSLLPTDLQAGMTINLDNAVTLTLLHVPQSRDDSLLFLLQNQEFTTLLPFENTQESQLAVLDQLPESLTLLPAPYPGTGTWPHPDLLAHVRPQIILQPEGTTYPPAVQDILAESTLVSSIPNDAVVEIISDGHSFNLLARPYSQDVMQR